MTQKYTEARKESNRKWDGTNLDRLSIALPKGTKDQIKAAAEAQGESVNAFINRVIDETLKQEGGKAMTEAQIRYELKKMGYRLEKDRARTISADHLGGYNVVDIKLNAVVLGGNYSCELSDIKAWIADKEADGA